MTFTPRLFATLTLGAACSGAWSLPAFTVNPPGASPGLIGAPVVADNMVLSNRSHVTIDTGSGTFTQAGMLSVQTLQLTGAVVGGSGLNDTYGMYFAYNATGTSTPGDMASVFTSGAYSSFNYTLFGFNGGPATFSFDAANNPVTSATGAFALGSGQPAAGQHQHLAGAEWQHSVFRAFVQCDRELRGGTR